MKAESRTLDTICPNRTTTTTNKFTRRDDNERIGSQRRKERATTMSTVQSSNDQNRELLLATNTSQNAITDREEEYVRAQQAAGKFLCEVRQKKEDHFVRLV